MYSDYLCTYIYIYLLLTENRLLDSYWCRKLRQLLSCLFASTNSFLEQWAIKFYGTERVVVSRHRIRYQIWIAVCVNYTNTGNIHLCSMTDCYMLSLNSVKSIEENTQVWQPCHSLELILRVRKQALSPVSRLRKLLALFSRFVHQICGLRISRDKQNYAASKGDMGSKVQRLSQ